MVDKIKAAALAADTQKQRGADFIARAMDVHKGRYDYSNVQYLRAATKVSITCSVHGPFDQTPANHLKGQGCPACGQSIKEQMGKARRIDTIEFVTKSLAVHGAQYNYSNSVYVSSNKPITIECGLHGPFTVARAEKHYMNAQGCPHCVSVEASSTPERIIADVMDALGVPFFKEYTFDECRSPTSNRKLRFDFYVPSKNVLIEFHGEQHFKKNKMMHKGDKFERMQEHDRIKAEYALKEGITLVTFTTSNLSQLRSCVEGVLR